MSTVSVKVINTFPFSTMYLREARFSSHTSAKTIHCNRLNAEAAKRIQLTFFQADIKEVYKKCHSFHYIFLKHSF